jgi:hypothetical protein
VVATGETGGMAATADGVPVVDMEGGYHGD